MTDLDKLAKSDAGAFFFCLSCHDAGMLHCSEVETCIRNGQMRMATYADHQASLRNHLKGQNDG